MDNYIMAIFIATSLGISIGVAIRVIIQMDIIKERISNIENNVKDISLNGIRSMSEDDKIFSLLRIIRNPDNFNKYELILSDGMHLLGNVKINKDDIYDQSTTIEFMTDLEMKEVINLCHYRLGVTPQIQIIRSKSGTPIVSYVINCKSHSATLDIVSMLSHSIREIYKDDFYLYRILDRMKDDPLLGSFKIKDYTIRWYNSGKEFESDDKKINIMMEEIDKNV